MPSPQHRNRWILLLLVLSAAALAPLGSFRAVDANRGSMYFRPAPPAPEKSLAAASQQQAAAVLTPQGTQVVTNGNDSGSGSLRNAISAAAPGDTITFSGVSTVTLTSGELDITQDLTINGGGGVTVTRSGSTAFRIFDIESGTVALSNLTISNGHVASTGGGIRNEGTLTITNCVIEDNTSDVESGGIHSDGTITITNSAILNNTSSSYSGGGISLYGPATITGSSFYSNIAANGNGGGIAVSTGGDLQGSLSITNCTLYNNTAGSGGSGGGISIETTLTNTIVNCTITNNMIDASSGAGLNFVTGTAKLTNTIVAGNFINGGGANDVAGNLSSISSHNLFGDSTVGGITNGINGNHTGVSNPGLTPIGNYGGPTQTCALSAGSLAIDAGTSSGAPSTDQRGVARPSGSAVDIGAFEASITVTPATVPSVTINQSYATLNFSALGGSSPYTFSEVGALPSGMTFDTSAGALYGTPTQSGNFTFTVVATDHTGIAGANYYTLSVISCPVIIVNPSNLNIGTAGSPYTSVTFSAASGTAPFTYVESGTLPTGMTFSSGVLSGTPTQSGSFPISVTATDKNGCTGTNNYTLTINCPMIGLNPSSLLNGFAGSPYTSTTFTTTAGVSPFTFSETGALPTGMTLSSSGVLSGTPTQHGSFPITVNVLDHAGCTGSRSYTLTINCPTIIINPSSLNIGTSGSPYTAVTFTNSGGVGSVTFSESGTLPTGMTFSGGVLSGTPTQHGSFPITVTATDSIGCSSSVNYTLTINCPTIIVNPSSINQATAGSSYTPVTFSGSGGSGTLTLSESGTLPSGMSYSNGTLSGTPTQTGSFPLSITATDQNGCTGTRSYTLTVNCATIIINPSSLSPGTAGGFFPSVTFSSFGGAGTVTFSETGTLPTGISFSNGTLSGTPTQTGNFPITIKATDSAGCITNQNYTLTINCAQISITPTSIGSARAGSFYGPVSFSNAFGTAVTFSKTGTLPNGVTLTSGGVLSGTPTQTGSFPITVTATDNFGCTGSEMLTLVVNCPTINVMPTSVHSGIVGQVYTPVVFNQTGGIGSVSFSESGTLPAGMDFSPTAGLEGTPTQPGSFPITITATDANGCTGSVNLTLTINCAPISVLPFSIPLATSGTAYASTTFSASGTSGTVTYSETGTLPAGMTFSGGVLSGTPTQSGAFPITILATDSNNCTGTRNYILAVNCAGTTLSMTPASLSQGTIGQAYTSTTFTATGGSGTFTYTEAGTLPTGMSFTSGVLSGTPSQSGIFPITVAATDSNGCATEVNYLLVIACTSETITMFPTSITGTSPGASYSQTFTASGGILPFTYYLGGALPAGMTFSNGTLSGTPTESGTFNFTVAANDSFGCVGSRNYTLTISCPTITIAPTSLSTGNVGVAYPSTTFTGSGGAGTTTYSESGTLPTGMTFIGGVLSGTPTQPGSFPITITATDSNGCTGTENLTLTISCPTIGIFPSTLNQGFAGSPYTSVTFTNAGGISPITYTETGALPTGMNLTAGVLSGTPTQTGSFPITVTATDKNGCTGSQNYTLTINCPTIAVFPSSLNAGTSGAIYSPVTFTNAGGVGTITFSESGTLPTGMSFSGGVLSGTPTQHGSFPITVTATDANGCTGTQSYTLTVNCPTIIINPSSLPTGTANATYSSTTFSNIGGSGTVTFSESGTLPTGMTFVGGVLSGTPTQSGSFPITVTATDANGCTGTHDYTLVINCPTIIVNPSSLNIGFGGSPYTSVTFSGAGGQGTITLSESGTLPNGITFSGGVLSGTPTQTGSFPISVTATDANGCTGSRNYTLTINCPTIGIFPSSLPTGFAGFTYTSTTFSNAGGVGTITFSESGILPTGLTFTNGTLSGTPLQSGSFPITITATDANGCSNTQNYTLVINCPTIGVFPSTIFNGTAGSFYTPVTFTNSAGVGTITFTETGTLPTGMMFSGGVLSGTPTQTGTFPFSVTATDSNGCHGTQNYTLVIGCSTVNVSPTTLASATVGVAYSAVTFTQTGGIGTVIFSETGTLPSGITFSSGVLSGTPTQPGSFPITVTATDANGCTGSVNVTLTVTCGSITLSPRSIPLATSGVVYPDTTFTSTGGVGTINFSETGALPSGMSFSAGVLSGTPTESGAFPITVTATDENGCTGTRNYIIAVACPSSAVTLSPGVLPQGTNGQPYTSTTFSASGGSDSYTYLEAGTLPTGMSFAGGVLSGTPTQSGVFPITVAAKDSNNCATEVNYLLVIACQGSTLTLSPGAVSGGVPNASYTPVTFQVDGATLPLTFYIAGSLPSGMTFSDGVLSGTPTESGTFQFTIAVTDANGCAGSHNYTLNISCPTITVSPGTVSPGNAGQVYSPVTFSSTGGSGTITYTETGSLPSGMTFTGGVLAGTPTQTGTFPFTVTATDANGCAGTKNLTLVINCSAILLSPLSLNPGITGSAYTAVTFSSTGGIGTIAYTETGTLPSGIIFSGGVLSGTPTQSGSFPFTVTATDANGCIGSQNYTLTVSCPTIVINPQNLNSGISGSPYSAVTFSTAGGSGTITFSESGMLPTGITFTGGVLSGTPTQSGSFPITVTATDINGCTGTRSLTLTVNCGTIIINPSSLNPGRAGSLYSSVTFSSSGGVGTVTFSESGTLPTGMTFSGGVLSGTPTQTGSFPISVTATDSNGCTNTQNYTLTINCPTIIVNPSNAPSGTAGAPYSSVTFSSSGGVGTVTYSKSGTLPTGMTFSGGVLSGTPLQSGSFPFSVTATDANGCTGTANYTLTVNCPTIIVNPSNVAPAATSNPYTPVTFSGVGGVGTTTVSETGTLPAGMSFVAGVLSGTPIQTGSFPFTVTATDSNGCTGSMLYTLVVNCGTITVSPSSLSPGTVGSIYSAVTFGQSGGQGTISFSETGTLPNGMSFSSGELSGTPTQSGSFPITVTATDSNGCTGSQNYTLNISCSTITVSPDFIPQGTTGAAYQSTAFTYAGGIGVVTLAETGALPAGMHFTAGVLSGTPTQSGAFPITITATDSNGCTGSHSYIITVECPSLSLSINPGVVPAGVNGQAYLSTTFVAASRTGTITYLEAGSLPTGMTFVGGVLSGTPTQSGIFPITVAAKDSTDCATETNYLLVIACQGTTINLDPGTITSGTAGSEYTPVAFSASGGAASYTYYLAGSLPTGMTFLNGTLSGTPTQPGTFQFTVAALDANGCAGSVNYTLNINCPMITIGPGTIPSGIAGNAYSGVTFNQTGGIGTVTFTHTGALSNGMTFSNGVLSGTPTQSGSFPITVTATDSNGCTGSKNYTISINCPSIMVSPGAIPSGTAGTGYTSTTFHQTGGLGTITFSESGTLPTGMTFVAGVLSGTPLQTGSFPITVTATDENGCKGSANYTLVIGCPVITVAPSTVPQALQGTAYIPVQFTQTGGIGSTTFSTSSTLPTGMTLSTAGVLSGTPAQGGTFQITVVATDSNGCTGSVTVSLLVSNLDKCLKDNSTGTFIQFNSVTGDYLFTICGPNGFTMSGKGTLQVVNNVINITDSKSDRKVTIQYLKSSLTGTATLTKISSAGTMIRYTINDTNPHAVCACGL